jgi:hypothetical protein
MRALSSLLGGCGGKHLLLVPVGHVDADPGHETSDEALGLVIGGITVSHKDTSRSSKGVTDNRIDHLLQHGVLLTGE